MNEERVQAYADMWTTGVSRYALVEVNPGSPTGCVVKDLITGGLVVIDDDDEVLEAVIRNMRQAGARIMTPEEARPR
ncbi:MAG: hypothetical protein R3B36_33190 [Polyangiaceae bacterium]